MKPRDIVKKAFAFEEPDIVPYNISMDPECWERVDSYYGSQSWRSELIPFWGGWHIGSRFETLPDGMLRDQFGTVMRSKNIIHIERPALMSPSLDGYKWPNLEDMEDWEGLARSYEQMDQHYRICGFAWGLFERSWLMRGFENILIDMLEHPQFVEDLLDGILKLHIEAMDLVVSRVPVEAYFGGDDMCDQRGPIMGVELWRRYFKPRYAELIAHCHSLGLPYILHSCGNVGSLIDDWLEIGLDGLESLQPEAMDIYELKKCTSGRMFLIGGMGMQSTMPFGSPEDVRRETLRLVREMGRGGGYVLAPAKPVMSDVPTANIAAFIETIVNQEEV